MTASAGSEVSVSRLEITLYALLYDAGAGTLQATFCFFSWLLEALEGDDKVRGRRRDSLLPVCSPFLEASPHWCFFALAAAAPSHGCSWLCFAVFPTFAEPNLSTPHPPAQSISTAGAAPRTEVCVSAFRDLSPQFLSFNNSNSFSLLSQS